MLRAILIFFIFLPAILRCQVYPIHISCNLTPPYSGYIADYADPSSEKLKVILQLNDFSVAQTSVRLKFEIKGNGFTLSTKTFFNPGPITLIPGQPLLITGSDLAPYLSSNNLDFSGVNQSQYEQKMSLPEGYYSVCITAYDYYNSAPVQVSNEACSQAWFTLSDPPYLNMPLCGSAVTPLNPQNIVFQWAAMNLGSPNSAFNTEYEFALWESRPDTNANPNQVVLSTAPVFSITTQQTFFNYSITEPALNLYMKYIWRVRAKDISGRDLFKNQGYSQVCTFKYGTAQNVLSGLELSLNAEAISHRMGRCDWNKQSIYTNYLLQVRKYGTTEWFDYNNSSGIEKIMNLEPSTQYEARVRGEGNGITGEWSSTVAFTTLQAPEYACNNQAIPANNSLLQPLPPEKAVKGLIIQSGQFDVHVTQIYPGTSSGWYGGKGYVSMMGVKKVPVKWSHIFIDSDGRQQQGVIEAETKGIESWKHNWDIATAENNATYVNGNIDSVYINGNQVCYSLQGSSDVICVPTPTDANIMVIRDGEGNQFNVDLVPPPPKVSGPFNYLEYSGDSLAASDNAIVSFEAASNQDFGLDKKQYAAFIKNYEAIKLKNGKNYFVANKSIGTAQSDKVIAIPVIENMNTSLLKFKTAGEVELSYSAMPHGKFLVSGITDDAGVVYAWYDNKKIGKLNVVSLKTVNKKVVVVPVNGVPVPANISASLHDAFKQANVSWTVTSAPNFSFGLGTDGLEAADATLFSKYSNEMRALRNAYQQADTAYDKNAYYLFVVPNFNNPDLKGYMVRGRAVGFIAQDAGGKEIAHELAHGAFALEHTFPAIEKGSSNNLMDYSNGVQLVKEQWSYTQYGSNTYRWTDNEEDASYLGPTNTAAGVFYWINKIKVAYKESKSVTIPANMSLIGKAGSCYLGGIQYDSICIYTTNYQTDHSADVYGKVNIIESFWGVPAKTYSCISIDGGKIIIQVPAARLSNMKFYIQNTQTFKNLILFVNGYRPVVNLDGDELQSPLEYDDSNNEIEFGDSRGYWKGIDAQFMNRIGTRTAIYADGHHSVETSNHNSVGAYLAGNLYAIEAKTRCTYNVPGFLMCEIRSYLHTDANLGGFLIRQNNGDKAAQDFIRRLNGGEIVFDKQTDTLDIVAHSMGYAYAVGMIKRLKSAGIKFGRFYILAPENAKSGGANWGDFTEVWQYGTDEVNCKPYFQDGVAPQCPVKGITSLPPNTLGGRVTIPENFWPKGYLASHTIKNYGWIFEKQKNDPGYVKPR